MKKPTQLIRYCILFSVFIVWVWCVLVLVADSSEDLIKNLAAIGDSFGVVTSLASVLGFMGLIYTIRQQKVAIGQQSEALIKQEKAHLLQIEEMRNDRDESKEQTAQFRKTYELDKRAKFVSARPYLTMSSSRLTRSTCKQYQVNPPGGEISATTPVIDLGFRLSNYGAEIREVELTDIEIKVGNNDSVMLKPIVGVNEPDVIATKHNHVSPYDFTFLFPMYEDVLRRGTCVTIKVNISYLNILGYYSSLTLHFSISPEKPQPIAPDWRGFVLQAQTWHDEYGGS